MIINLILIYITLLLIKINKLDSLDKNAIFSFVKLSNYYKDIGIPFKNIVYYVNIALKMPFKSKDYFSQISEGGLYQAYLLKYEKKVLEKLDCKYHWYLVFKKYQIPHPRLILTKRNNNIKSFNRIENSKSYILKPLNGCLGLDIKKVKGYEILEKIKHKNNLLIQDMLIDCNTEKSRHFRYISLNTGEPFVLYELKSSALIVSNHAAGGNVSLCKYLECKSFTQNEKKSINKIIKKLSDLHKKEFNYVFSIGWDLMLNCENKTVKSYCLEGNIMHSTWFYPDIMDKNIIKLYKKKLLKYLISINYIKE